jgi:hypothetical protein
MGIDLSGVRFTHGATTIDRRHASEVGSQCCLANDDEKMSARVDV